MHSKGVGRLGARFTKHSTLRRMETGNVHGKSVGISTVHWNLVATRVPFLLDVKVLEHVDNGQPYLSNEHKDKSLKH